MSFINNNGIKLEANLTNACPHIAGQNQPNATVTNIAESIGVLIKFDNTNRFLKLYLVNVNNAQSIDSAHKNAAIEAVESLYGQKPDEKSIQTQKTRKDFQGDITLVVFPLLRLSECLGLNRERPAP